MSQQATHVKRQPTLGDTISRAQIQRRTARHEDANSALELAALRRQQLDQANARAHRAALNTIDAIDRTMELENANRPMATPLPTETRTAQTPAAMPPAAHVYEVSGFRPWPAVTALALGLMFIAGMAVGRSL